MGKWNFRNLFQDAVFSFVLLAVFVCGVRGQTNVTDSDLGNSTVTSTDEANSQQDNPFYPHLPTGWTSPGHNASFPAGAPEFNVTTSNMTSPNMTSPNITSSAANVTGGETSPGTEGEFWETDTRTQADADDAVHGMSVDTPGNQNRTTDNTNTTFDFEATTSSEDGNFTAEETFTEGNATEGETATSDAGSPPFEGLPTAESSQPTHASSSSGPNVTTSPWSSDLEFAPGVVGENASSAAAGDVNNNGEDAHQNATVDDAAWGASAVDDDEVMNTTAATTTTNDTNTNATMIDDDGGDNDDEEDDDYYGDDDYYYDDDDDSFYDAGEDDNDEPGGQFGGRGNGTEWDAYYGETNSTFNETSLDDAAYNDTSFNDASFNDTSFNYTSFDDASFNDASFNDTSFDDASFNDESFNDESFNDTTPVNNVTVTEATDMVNFTDAYTDLDNETTPSDDDFEEDDYYDDDYYSDYEEEEPEGYSDDDVAAANDTLPDDADTEGYDIASKPTDEATPQAPEKADFVVYESDGSPCLLASLNITIHFKYAVQEGLVRETYETVSKKNTQDGSSHQGTCESQQSSLSITWSNATFTLNLTFTIQDKEVADSKRIDMDVRPPGANTSGQYWSLEQVSLSYDTANDLMFPGAYNPTVRTVMAEDLNLFQTPLGLSYVCRTPEVVTVQFKDVDLAFNFIHLMPFGVTDHYFSNVTVECSGDMHSVPATEDYTVPLIVASVLAGIVCAIILVYGTMRCVTRRLRQADYKQME